ncbi:type II toxin-antitoxin system death-on-curing family toxin [Enterococcus raffinosus]|uniref:type II toxin-antitoxin system death-on-curing family toxin n=1 Tax=Enterococcus raffinosus TaxID=71452 RepID=UPI001C1208F6|nr:type II toxin-antitoxin system death-on-curing family toxin [Enterococcus raffinosus]MBU5363488.1 type II toxin-antitoxin system death-on-curing family toxin [Enterococcus raffinosus]
MTINYLKAEDISKINAFQIVNYSPDEQLGIKDINALERTVNQPAQHVFGREFYVTIEEKAAILMINLIKKHPFHNATKRTAMIAVDIFLHYSIQFDLQEGIDLVVSIATDESSDFENLKDSVSQIIGVRTTLS